MRGGCGCEGRGEGGGGCGCGRKGVMKEDGL